MKTATFVTLILGMFVVAALIVWTMKYLKLQERWNKGTYAESTNATATKNTMVEFKDEAFKAGIFWGVQAVIHGATNINDAEQKAYELRRQAAEILKAQKEALSKLTPVPTNR